MEFEDLKGRCDDLEGAHEMLRTIDPTKYVQSEQLDSYENAVEMRVLQAVDTRIAKAEMNLTKIATEGLVYLDKKVKYCCNRQDLNNLDRSINDKLRDVN